MTPSQKKALFRACSVGIVRSIFCGIIIPAVGRMTGILGLMTSICLGLYTGRGQKWMNFLTIILSVLTALSFLFSMIPTYNKTPSLTYINITEIPFIACLDESDNTTKTRRLSRTFSPGEELLIGPTRVALSAICAREKFPFLPGQTITLAQKQDVIIGLGKGYSSYIIGPTRVMLSGTVASPLLLCGSEKNATPCITYPTSTVSSHPLQATIFHTYRQRTKDYLRTNYNREREQAPGLTRLALRKMRLIGLIDRSYNDKAKNLERYLQQLL